MAHILYASRSVYFNKPYEDFLQSKGHRVIHVDSFPAAMRHVQDRRFDLVITEVLLRESPLDSVRIGIHYCSGLNLIDIMRQDGPNKDTPVVVHSVLGKEMIDGELEKRGITIHLQMHVEMEDLEASVEAGLAGRQ